MKHRIDLWYGSLVPIQYAVYSTHYTVYSARSFIILRMAFAVAFTVGLTAGFSAPLPKPPLPLNFNPCGNQKGGGGGGGGFEKQKLHKISLFSFQETKVAHDRGTLWLLPRAAFFRGSLCGSPHWLIDHLRALIGVTESKKFYLILLEHRPPLV